MIKSVFKAESFRIKAKIHFSTPIHVKKFLFMKNNPFIFVFALVLFMASCTSGEKAETAQTEEPTSTETTTEPTTEPAAAPAPETAGDNYAITVIKGDIASPRKEMMGSIGEATIKVNYGSPSVKGRAIWGELVPFNQVWRTGANEATTFEVDKNITISGKELPAGKYGLFTIPKEEGWTIIFNTEAEQWGHYEYDESKDVLRVDVPTKPIAEASETMDFMIDGDQVVITWEKLSVPIALSAS